MGKSGRVSNEMKEIIVELFKEGKTMVEIAKELNIDKGTIRYWLVKFGFNTSLSNATAPTNSTACDEIMSLYKEGFSIKKISYKLDVSETTVRRVITRELKVLSPHAQSIYDKIKDDLLSDHSKGMLNKELMEKYNLSNQALNDMLICSKKKINVGFDRSSYKMRYDFFKVLNNKSAYVLGLIASVINETDKLESYEQLLCVTNHTNQDILDKIAKEIYIGKYPEYKKAGGSRYLRLISEDMNEDLVRYGITSSLKIPKEFMKSFMDGYLYNNFRINNKMIRVIFTIPSHREAILNYLQNDLDIQKIKDRYSSIEIYSCNVALNLLYVHTDCIDVILNSNYSKRWERFF